LRLARRLLVTSCLLSALAGGVTAQKTPAHGGSSSITPADLKEWLTYIASDELEGRLVHTEGLGLAAAYIADHLREWGVKPAGTNGTYFQTVKVLGVRTTSQASITVDVNGQSRTFKDGDGITFPRYMGGKQTIQGDQVQFVGYGLQIPSAGIDDYAGLDPKGKIVIYLGQAGPKTAPSGSTRVLNARSRSAVEKGAAAVIGVGGGFGLGRGAAAQNPPAAGAPGTPAPQPGAAPAVPPAGRGRGNQPDNGDFTTVQRYDLPVVPAVTARDEFFEFLFSGSGTTYAELKDKAANREPLPVMALKGVKITIDVDADYTVVRTRLSRNVVGIVPGADSRVNGTYVAFGAHYDHVGYREGTPLPSSATPEDRISNGADDDGSGTVALMALARAFAQGPKPKRSLLFVWHTGEESGLWGSRYNADFPIVPNEQILAQLNIDMIGRNRNDKPEEANTVYLVGSDRISTELHNLSEEANAKMATPMKLDYELNDPADPESIYTRSDHYSYAAKGIPIIFYTTGLHKDYHRVTDSVEKIEFPKLARITQLVYATAVKVANLDHAPVRDNKGPRMGKGAAGKLDGK
jgi:hypothetical protein